MANNDKGGFYALMSVVAVFCLIGIMSIVALAVDKSKSEQAAVAAKALPANLEPTDVDNSEWSIRRWNGHTWVQWVRWNGNCSVGGISHDPDCQRCKLREAVK
jgi:hypothetical protein